MHVPFVLHPIIIRIDMTISLFTRASVFLAPQWIRSGLAYIMHDDVGISEGTKMKDKDLAEIKGSYLILLMHFSLYYYLHPYYTCVFILFYSFY